MLFRSRYGILAPPRVRLPPWVEISAGGVPVPPNPIGPDLAAAIEERRRRLPEEMRAMTRYAPDSPYWKRRFRRERRAAINMSVAEREETPMHRRNAAARRAFWLVPGRTVQSAITDARREDFIREANAAGDARSRRGRDSSCGIYRRRTGLSYIAQDQGQTRTKASHSKCLLPYYLSLSIMHCFTSEVLQKLNKNYFF